MQYISFGELGVGGWLVHLDFSVSSGPILRFLLSMEFLSEMFDHSVCEIRDPSLTISGRKRSLNSRLQTLCIGLLVM